MSELRLAYSNAAGGVEVFRHQQPLSRFEGKGRFNLKAINDDGELIHVIPHGDEQEMNVAARSLMAQQRPFLVIMSVIPDTPENIVLLRQAKLRRLPKLVVQAYDETHGWYDTGETYDPTDALLSSIKGIVNDTFDTPFPVEPRRVIDENGNVISETAKV